MCANALVPYMRMMLFNIATNLGFLASFKGFAVLQNTRSDLVLFCVFLPQQVFLDSSHFYHE